MDSRSFAASCWQGEEAEQGSMQRVYIYKLTGDDGGAPCVCDGILSLAICKPAIRAVPSVAAARNVFRSVSSASACNQSSSA